MSDTHLRPPVPVRRKSPRALRIPA
jgi:hypothetical protein